MRAELGEPRRQGGISLIPTLWERIEEAASLAGVSRNRIMERVLMERFGLSKDVHKVIRPERNGYGAETVRVIDG